MDKSQKNRLRYLLIAIMVCQAPAAMTILFAQSPEPLTSLTNKEYVLEKPKHAQKTERKNEMNGANDFDFLVGNWRVHYRRLKERLANSHEWIEFDGTCAAQKILGGLGNMDDNVLNLPGGGYRAVTVRTYDPAKEQWSIWWIDGRNPALLDPPVVGRFEDGVGTFYAEDKFNGKPIRVRFFWTNAMTDTPHWEQAFSIDGGKTWETNWTMDFGKIR